MSGEVGLEPAGPTHAAKARWRSAAVGVSVGAAVALLGTVGPWRYCSGSPCDAEPGEGQFLIVFSLSGVEIGPGVAAALLSLAALAVGVGAVRRRGVTGLRPEALAYTALIVMIAAGYLVSLQARADVDQLRLGNAGAVLTLIGGLIAAVAAWRLEPSDEAESARVRARRLPRALLLASAVVWALAIPGHLSDRDLRNTVALVDAGVLLGLGIGFWPGRLPRSRLAPSALGVIAILATGIVFMALLLGGVDAAWLAAIPLLVVVVVGIAIALDLPPPAPANQPRGFIDALESAVRSPAGLLALGAVVVASAVGLVAAENAGWFDAALRAAILRHDLANGWVVAGNAALLAGLVAGALRLRRPR